MKLATRVGVRLVVMAAVVIAALLAPHELAWGAPQTRASAKLDVGNGATATTDFPATHVVVSWTGDAGATVQVRAAKSSGDWQQWQTARTDGETSETEQEAGMLLVDNASRFQARVLDGNATDLKVVAIDADNGPRPLKIDNSDGKAGALSGLTPQPSIVTRSQWGANESLRKGTPEYAPIQRMDVHHTVTANNDPNPAATVRAIYAYHTQSNGWNDIGYNFLVDQNGTIYEGRKGAVSGIGEDANGNGVVGAHTLNHNPGTVGIALLGTFNSTAPTAAQQDALVRLGAWEADRHNIDPTAPGELLGHRDLYQTECPGDVAYALLPQWRTRMNSIKAVYGYPPGNTPGYWTAGADGRVTSYGSAVNYGSLVGTRLNAPIVGLARTPSGRGYWLLGADGGIFTFGDARFFGSTGSVRLNKPIVGLAATPSGNGYYLVASDGGVFTFGDAQFKGSTGSVKLNQPIVTMVPTPAHDGYWLVAKDGGVFAFNAEFLGSIPMLAPRSYGGTVQAAGTSTGHGYYLLSADGGVYTFGDARFWGASTGLSPSAGIVLAS